MYDCVDGPLEHDPIDDANLELIFIAHYVNILHCKLVMVGISQHAVQFSK